MEDLAGLGQASIKTEGAPVFECYTGSPRKSGWRAEAIRRLRRAYWALRGETGF